MKSFYPTLLLWSLLLVAGCNDTGFVDEISTGTQQTITLSVSMPDNGDTDTRVTAGQIPNSPDIALKWNEGDEIQLYFKLGDIIFTGEKVKVQNISADGKTAQFQVDVPPGITGSFDLYGVHGTTSENVNGAILLDATPDVFVKLEDAKVPLYFKMENVTAGSVEQSVIFKHFGALQVVTLKNTANQKITVGNPALVFSGEKWYYDASGNEYPLYDIVSGSVSMEGRPSGIVGQLNFNIGYDDNVKLAQWVMPNGKEPPAISLKAEINGTEKTTSPKDARTSPMETGHAYHLYALWDGTGLSFANNEADVQAYKITMTTSKIVGSSTTISLYIGAASADQGGVWIDLNNNGVKDENEEITKFGSLQNYTIASQTVTLYGKVTTLYCYSNSLTALDVSNNTALTTLSCSSNSLMALDVTKNTALTSLYCQSNSLTALDVSNNTTLTYLNCYSNSLTALDVTKNTALTTLYCENNSLTALDVSNNTALRYLYCQSNSLMALDVTNNTALTSLYCYSNSLTALDVTKNTALTTLSCYSNPLATLDVSKNTALTSLYCSSNSLTELDVSTNTKLTSLKCYSNSLMALDVTYNTALTTLYCYSNDLTTLNVSGATALTYLYCHLNSLDSLDVSYNTALTSLDCSNNKINGDAMDILVNSLPDRSAQKKGYFWVINTAGDENECTQAQKDIATGKYWNVLKSDGNEYFP